MEDVLKRLGGVESSVSELRIQVSGIAAKMATKDELNELRVQVSAISATIPHLATSSDLKAGLGSLRTEISAMKTRIIKWIIATVIATAGVAFSIAKFVH